MELIFSTEALFFVAATATIATEVLRSATALEIARSRGRHIAEIAKKLVLAPVHAETVV
ncbi:hypothetical protein C8R31_102378 [Nitrosospira sp. Nsp2]|uniref:hypothetical protein n=1 Tax=Nitrosospira sp. Nsp2 TaxID=136548 RepID=UPI000D41DE36|nr:hypothetical protein [Nitrosospira sp. Nsp2]PTR16364.1 hypothetical protein C8R31_102378 [Nitrosospira sp. Nsp2]